MRTWMADLFGLAIGFAIGGAVLVFYLPQLEAYWQPAPPAVVAKAAPQPVRVPPPAPLPRVVALAPLPGIAAPAPLQPYQPPPLPNIVQPDQPAKITGLAGTGFFIGDDGTLLTAAHVVKDCRRTQVVSRYVHLTAATILATDQHDDLALLRADGVHPPALLPLGLPARRKGQVFVLGYPATAGRTVPAETWATLENSSLPPNSGQWSEPGFMIWLEASAVTHGYSGGPIVDPRDGNVVGLIKAGVDPASLHRLPRMPDSGVAIGPGASRLIAFVQRQEPWLDVTRADVIGEQTLSLARRATVHVFCWR